MTAVAMSAVVQVVPSLPPPPEGVSGNAIALAGALSAHCGIETRFVTGAATRTAEALLTALEEEDTPRVLLHYANYGYHARGCPSWLVDGLGRWQQRGASRKLITLFHEVWATGPPWRSSFWLVPFQRRLARAVAHLSAGMVTSLELYARMIRSRAAGRPVRVMPVLSTIGEPAAVPPFGERAPRLAVFGGSGVRARAWTREASALAAACRALEIEEIVDVGAPAGAPRRLGGLPVRETGVLPGAEVAAVLLGSRAGFVSYPPTFLPKSGIFAAYCSHGVVPVCAWSRRAPRAGPLPPFWRSGQDPGAVAEQARAWYAEHALERQAKVFREMLLGREDDPA